jgi:hypothetical protein
LRPKLTYANVVATVALFIALGGASYAALKLPKNSVGPKQLRKNAVTTPKIKNNTVTSAKVKDNSLQAADFKAGQLPAGSTGPQGPPGSDAFGELIYVEASELNPNGAQTEVEADCPDGYYVTGGGVFGQGSLGQSINSSFPRNKKDGGFGNKAWGGYVNNETGSNSYAYALAICAKAGKVNEVSGP